jgi:hypothetical protein
MDVLRQGVADHRDFKPDELPAWADSLQPSQYGRFLQLVAYELERRCARWTVDDGGVQAVRDNGESFALGLRKVAQLCIQAGEESWSEIMRNHFVGIDAAQAFGEVRADLLADFERVREYLKLRLYSDGYLAHAPNCYWPLAPGLNAVLVLDLPEMLANVKPEERALWPIANDELYDLALRNTVEQEEPPHVNPFTWGRYGEGKILLGSSLFVTTHALVLGNFLAETSAPGALLLVPSQHRAMVMPFDRERVFDVLGPLLHIGHTLCEEGIGPLSPHVYWVARSHIDVLRGHLEGTRIRLDAPARFMLMFRGPVPAYLPITVPATPAPLPSPWHRTGKGKPRKGWKRS